MELLNRLEVSLSSLLVAGQRPVVLVMLQVINNSLELVGVGLTLYKVVITTEYVPDEGRIPAVDSV